MKRSIPGGQAAGTPGFRQLDRLEGGLHAGGLTIIAGRRGRSKTSLAVDLACNMALIEQRPVLFVSLDSGKKELPLRMLSVGSGIKMERLKNPERLMTVDFARLAAAVEKINKCQMHTVCCKKASVSEIKRWARTLRAKSHMDIGLIIIDHPSLIPGRKGAGKGVQEISKTLLSLKSLAGQLEVPIVVFSKLNKRFSSGPDIYSLEKSSDTGFYKDIVIFCPL